MLYLLRQNHSLVEMKYNQLELGEGTGEFTSRDIFTNDVSGLGEG